MICPSTWGPCTGTCLCTVICHHPCTVTQTHVLWHVIPEAMWLPPLAYTHIDRTPAAEVGSISHSLTTTIILLTHLNGHFSPPPHNPRSTYTSQRRPITHEILHHLGIVTGDANPSNVSSIFNIFIGDSGGNYNTTYITFKAIY